MLNNLHANWKYGSYKEDRNYQIKLKENTPLMSNKPNAGKFGYDNVGRAVIGYGYDLPSRNIETILTDFASVGIILSSSDENLLRQYKLGNLTSSELNAPRIGVGAKLLTFFYCFYQIYCFENYSFQ